MWREGSFFSELGKTLLWYPHLPLRWGAFGPKRGRALMAQPVTAILSNHAELAAKARAFTGDANEAGLLVGKVVSRAFNKFKGEAAHDVVLHAMQRDLDAMIEKLRRTKL
jgi:hypothetical protein